MIAFRNQVYSVLTKASYRVRSPYRRLSLLELGRAHRTDKVSSGYLPQYDRYLNSIRHSANSVLEIGIGGHDKLYSGGYSLLMWRDYFSRAVIHGFDLVDKSHLNSHRIQTHICDQGSPESLKKASEGLTFDLIVDDGSHFVDHQIISFDSLFPLLNPGGFYIIEDTCGSFMARLRGNYPVGGAVSHFSSLIFSCYSSCIPSEFRENLLPEIQTLSFWGNKSNVGGFVLIEKSSELDIPPDSEAQLDAFNLDFDSYQLKYPEWTKSKSGLFMT